MLLRQSNFLNIYFIFSMRKCNIGLWHYFLEEFNYYIRIRMLRIEFGLDKFNNFIFSTTEPDMYKWKRTRVVGGRSTHSISVTRAVRRKHGGVAASSTILGWVSNKTWRKKKRIVRLQKHIPQIQFNEIGNVPGLHWMCDGVCDGIKLICAFTSLSHGTQLEIEGNVLNK